MSNPYANLPLDDLKSLKRKNKANPLAFKLIEEALEARKTHKRGSLKEGEMMAVDACLSRLQVLLPANPQTPDELLAAQDLATAQKAVAQHRANVPAAQPPTEPSATEGQPATPVTEPAAATA